MSPALTSGASRTSQRIIGVLTHESHGMTRKFQR
jgi:hypothetical protein